MKHSHSRLIYYMIIGVTRRFFNSLLGVGYPGETLSLVFDILLPLFFMHFRVRWNGEEFWILDLGSAVLMTRRDWPW